MSSTTGDRWNGAAAERATAVGLAVLLLIATLGEGGGHPTSMMVWHGWLVGLLAWVALAGGGRSTGPRSVATVPLVACASFLMLFAVGVVRAPYTYGALLVAIEMGACLAAGWIGSRIGSRGLLSLVTPLQVGAALQGVWVIVQWLLQDSARPTGTFLNANHLGLWVIAVTLLAFGAARVGDGQSDLLRRALLALPAAAAVVLAGSRGAAVGLVAGGAWLIGTRWSGLSRRRRVAFVAAFVLVVGLVGWRQLERVEQHDPFRYQRWKIWKASVGAIADDPWWGTGPGQFSSAAANLGFPDGEGPLRFDRTFEKTHSDLLRLPAEFGLPTALAALIAMVAAVRTIAWRRRSGGLPRFADGAIAALMAIAAQGLVDNPSKWPGVYLLASVLLGCLLSSEREAVPRLGRSARAGLVCTLLLVFSVVDVAPFLAWRENTRSSRGDAHDEGRRLARALRLNPIHPDYRMRLARSRLAQRTPWDLDGYAAAREGAEHAVRLHPAAAHFHRGLAEIEARACRDLFRDEACRSRVADRYHRAARRSRHDPFLAIDLAGFLLDTGDAAGARRAAERALSIEPEAVLPRLLLADALLEGGAAGDLERASALIFDARARAAGWADWDGGPYGQGLLQPDPQIFDRLEAKLAALSAAPPADPPPAR